MLQWLSAGIEPSLGQWGLKTVGVTERLGVPEYGRAPKAAKTEPRSGLSAGVAINHDQGTVGPLLLEQEPNKWQIRGDSLSSARRSALLESAGFGDSKWGRVSEIEMLGHSPGEHGVWLETREAGGSDCFTLRAP